MVIEVGFKVGFKVVSLFLLGTRISLSIYGWPSSGYGSTLSLLTLAGF